ncbi:hypothetical protein [Polaromonas sp. CG9_12]|nr:hypothetical protein [Polaromonas sp. CG9_12]
MEFFRRFSLLNPFWALFFIYFSANINSVIFALLGFPVDVDSQQYIFELNDIFWAGVALLISFVFVLAIYIVTLLTMKVRSNLGFGSAGAITILFGQIAYLGYSYFYGVNIAGVEDSVEGNMVFRLAFSILQPELLFLIVAPGLKSDRYFWINSGVYIASSLIRGWMGAPFLLFILILIRKFPISFTSKKLMYLGFSFMLGILFLPLIVSLKWSIRSGEGFDQALTFLSEVGYFNYMVESFGYILNRFQMFGHIMLLAQNSDELFSAYEAGSFIPYWMDGAPQWVWLRFNGVEVFQLNKYMVSVFFGSDNFAYSTNPGIAGWLFVLKENSIFFVFYLLLITFFPSILVLKWAGPKYFLLLMCFMLVYLFHGWIGAYFNFIFYLLMLMGISKLFFKNTFFV